MGSYFDRWKVEIVTPTIIQGVTFNAQPPSTTNGLEYWVSLKDDGSPKTIKPQMKNGQIKMDVLIIVHGFKLPLLLFIIKNN